MSLRDLWPGSLTTFLKECGVQSQKICCLSHCLSPREYIAKAVRSSLIHLYVDDTVFTQLEVVTSYKYSYKYLGVWLDSTLSFSQHISKLQAKVKSRHGFRYSNRSSFTPAAKLTLIQMTILPMLDYRGVIYRLAGKGALERLDVLYHSAIRCATNAPYRTHHCTLYSSVNCSSLYTCRKTHWLMLIYKTLFGLTHPYLRYLLQPSSSKKTPVLPVTFC